MPEAPNTRTKPDCLGRIMGVIPAITTPVYNTASSVGGQSDSTCVFFLI